MADVCVMENILSKNLSFAGRGPVPASEVRIEGVGVRHIDQRRVDVAVDLTPCLESITVRMAIVGPDDDEWASTAIVQNREPILDKVMHLRQDAGSGAHTLYVGVFHEDELLTRTARRFAFSLADFE